ncbi:MAG TPA: ferritin-like domain-containing protein [Acidimicrobiales bacterium]|jgi:hypothetical protein
MPTSEGLHEPWVSLSADVIDRHRAIVSLGEELEAVDWYDQRVNGTSDASLAAVLAHNRDEEKEHAAMTLEWLRRRDRVFDQHLRTYLFTESPITEVEAEAEAADVLSSDAEPEAMARPLDGSLGIGSLKGRS